MSEHKKNKRQYKRGTATEILLRILQRQAEFTVDLCDTFFSSREASYKKIRARLGDLSPAPRFKTDWAEMYAERQRFYKLLSLLESQGLVTKSKRGRKSFWNITTLGNKQVCVYDRRSFVAKPTTFPTVISYDIPETRRRDRDWLRGVLRDMEFAPAQRSVWVANRKVPENFLQELKQRKLTDCVQILGANKTGTLAEN
ncbi:MAG: hypothetical protein HZA95_04270 [Candidatus Vogelbacteria bacterium]|nr:hypothetical protein [Candidatus Vogelbacteria bacterium]